MGCHPSHWRTHIFKDGLLHHQPENDDSSKGISTTRNGQTKHASHERLEIQHVAQPCAGFSIFFIQMKPTNAATTMQVECSTFQESIQEQMPFSPKQKIYFQPETHSTLCNGAIIRSPNHLRFRDHGGAKHRLAPRSRTYLIWSRRRNMAIWRSNHNMYCPTWPTLFVHWYILVPFVCDGFGGVAYFQTNPDHQ